MISELFYIFFLYKTVFRLRLLHDIESGSFYHCDIYIIDKTLPNMHLQCTNVGNLLWFIFPVDLSFIPGCINFFFINVCMHLSFLFSFFCVVNQGKTIKMSAMLLRVHCITYVMSECYNSHHTFIKRDMIIW